MGRKDGRRSGGGGSRRRRRKPPDPETVVSESKFVSPKGRVYRILRTNQTDPYDPPGGAAQGGPGERTRP
jgi:hypothetical protein